MTDQILSNDANRRAWGPGHVLWESHNDLKLNNISSFINMFNTLGFLDICNKLTSARLTFQYDSAGFPDSFSSEIANSNWKIALSTYIGDALKDKLAGRAYKTSVELPGAGDLVGHDLIQYYPGTIL